MSAPATKAAVPPPANSLDAEAAKKKRKTKKNSSFGRCLKAPYRALLCARDFYVKTLGGCAGGGGGGGGGKRGGTVGFSSVLMSRAGSRSTFGPSNRFGSGDNDFMDLVRANSKVSVEAASAAAEKAAANGAVQRSQSSVPGIGRIDEERSCDFEADLKPGIGGGLRSQSCTVAAGRKMPRGTV